MHLKKLNVHKTTGNKSLLFQNSRCGNCSRVGYDPICVDGKNFDNECFARCGDHLLDQNFIKGECRDVCVPNPCAAGEECSVDVVRCPLTTNHLCMVHSCGVPTHEGMFPCNSDSNCEVGEFCQTHLPDVGPVRKCDLDTTIM